MELRKIESSFCLSPLMQGLYVDSFPPAERRGWESVCDLVDNERRYEFFEITDCGEPIGFITLWHLGPVVYGEHFAINPARRGAGLGGKVVEMIINRCDQPWIIEVEPREMSEEASRRIGFYSRHGMKLHEDFTYRQPSYGAGLPSVELKLMTSRDGVDLKEATRLIHKYVYKSES